VSGRRLGGAAGSTLVNDELEIDIAFEKCVCGYSRTLKATFDETETNSRPFQRPQSTKTGPPLQLRRPLQLRGRLQELLGTKSGH